MLHSSLPRPFLAPGINYLGYYSDEVHQHPYVAPTAWHIPMQSPSPAYMRVSEHHTLHTNWDSARPSTPCPLDLSLKPPPTPSTPRTEGTIEVDNDNNDNDNDVDEDDDEESEEKDRGCHEDGQRQMENKRHGRNSEDAVLIDSPETLSPTCSIRNRQSYEQLLSKNEPGQFQEAPDKSRILEEVTRLTSFGSTNEIASKYHPHNQKFLLSSPSHSQSTHNYHQQLLLTPQHHLQGMQHAPMTPPSTPSPPQCPRRRVREEEGSPVSMTTTITTANISTPVNTGPRQTNSVEKPPQRSKKKHARRLKFDEDTSSPVSGTVILGPDEAVVTGDIDPAFNIVEITEEARAELAKIENRLGPYQCKLCRQLHEDAFQLAQHRCSRIAHVEYRCPECDKRFSCPANLASHRRWHKPRLTNGENSTSASSIEISCSRCEAKFTRQAALRKHLTTQHPETNNNNVLLETQEMIGKADVIHLVNDTPSNTEMP